MDSKKNQVNPADVFKELRLDEDLRTKLADLARVADASPGPPQGVTFISAQSDTLPPVREEKKNA